jgi:predicted RNase H-like nuclease (RuvC/YqgF family)
MADVEAAAKLAEAAAEDARARALDPLVADVIVARREMDDAAFKRDRLTEAAKRLGARVEELKALEKYRAEREEHQRVSAERERLAAEFGRMTEAIVEIGRLVREIDLCDREIGRLNATSAMQQGYIPLVLSGAAPAIKALFQDVVVWDAFISVARLPSKAA